MESSATGRCIPQKSKKRVFPGSSSCMEPEVEMSSPPGNRALKSKTKMLKQEEDAMVMSSLQNHSMEGVHSSKEAESNKKGKGIIISSVPSSAIQLDSEDIVSDSFNGEDYMDLYADAYVSEDEYSILQSHFDNIDFPAGIEAPIPWFRDCIKMRNKMASTRQDIASATCIIQSTDPNRARPNSSLMDSPILRTPLDRASRKHKVEQLPLRSSAGPPINTQRSAGSSSSTYSSRQAQVDAMKVWSVKKPLKARRYRMSSGSGGSSSHNGWDQLGSLKVPGTRPSFPHRSNARDDARTSHFSQLPVDAVYPLGVDPQAIVVEINDAVHAHVIPTKEMLLDQDFGKSQKSLNVARSSSSMVQLGDNDVLSKYQNFKKFDIVEDHSDHHYSTLPSAMKQPPRNWAKKIQEEWRILEKDLPDMIFVRVYESRMDLLRAVIIGAEGTPYHDGLFFFDVYFPSNYPNVPPQVHYHSGGLRINPNLYANGKVCLSLLNTWIGVRKEKWIPDGSTMLQVLVSIQGLILNAKPYFNEPGFADLSGSVDGENFSLEYNERTLILSLKTMVCTMKKPPKHFEDLVIGHFRDRAHGILTACKAYTEGAQVGYVADNGKGTCSAKFKNDVGWYMKTLAGAFKQIGAADVQESLSLTQKIRTFFGI